jgi:hypothetical protein
MEIALFVCLIFLLAIVFGVISIPLLIISRLTRMLKKSYAKLFTKSAKA